MSIKNLIQQTQNDPLPYAEKQYQEIIKYLDDNWHNTPHQVIQALNQALGNLSLKLSSIIIAGTNGKSATIHYLEEILGSKNIAVGSFSSPHFISYNERFKINGQAISDEEFIQLANQVLQITKNLNLKASSKDILTAMALILFTEKKVELAIFAQDDLINKDPVSICSPIILAIPKITELDTKPTSGLKDSVIDTSSIDLMIDNIINNIAKKTYVISSDQNKLSLKTIAEKTKQKNGVWTMSIRKVAPLSYPFEQLSGRYAALADRIVQTDTEQYCQKESTSKDNANVFKASRPLKNSKMIYYKITDDSLKNKKIKNLHLSSIDFWKSINNNVPNKFQAITKDDTTILLDCADNIDDFNNLFLGVRLLNYKNNFKSISFIVGGIKGRYSPEGLIKLMRSYFKKNIQIVGLLPISNEIGEEKGTSFNIKEAISAAVVAKIKAVESQDLISAINSVFQSINEPKQPSANLSDNNQENLIVITGSQAIISQYLELQKKIESTPSYNLKKLNNQTIGDNL